jgi:TonB family protein
MTTKAFFRTTLTFVFFLALCFQNVSAQTQADVDKMPEYPGGNEALMTYLVANIKYPETAKKEKAEGMVVVKFVVKKDGKVSKVHTVSEQKDLRADLSTEAIRVIKNMPKWIPAEDGGKKVDCEMALPIKFKLD